MKVQRRPVVAEAEQATTPGVIMDDHGARVVDEGEWVITHADGRKEVLAAPTFEQEYAPLRVIETGMAERAMTNAEKNLIAVLNAILLKEGGQIVVADSYVLGQPLRMVIIERRVGHLFVQLGPTEAEIANGKGGEALLWMPPAKGEVA